MQVVYRPIHWAIIGGNSHFTSLARVVTGPKQGRILQKTAFRILVGIDCQNISTHTPQSWYHGVTKVAKTGNTAKMAKNCINRTSARLTPPHATPMVSGP